MIDPYQLDGEFFQFLKENEDKDYVDLLLKKSADPASEEIKRFAALQIRARRSMRGKISHILENNRFLIPDLLVSEQSSNEYVASYNASLAGAERLADLTAGLGIDAINFSAEVCEVVAVEKDEWRSRVMEYNLKTLGIDNVKVVNNSAESFLEENREKYDFIYLDPSRRGEQGGRIFKLSDCQPDVEGLMPLLEKNCNRLLIKASPLLDLKDAEQRLPDIERFHIVEYKRECKEILIEINFRKKEKCRPEILCVNVMGEKEFQILEIPGIEKSDNRPLNAVEDLKPGLFLYEPSPSLLKSGRPDIVFKLDENLRKLDPNTHLFVSENFIPEFPGKTLIMEGILERKDYKTLKNKHFNVISRNHPLKADKLIKKFSVIPGGEKYLLACKACGKPIIILAEDGRQLS